MPRVGEMLYDIVLRDRAIGWRVVKDVTNLSD